MAISPQPFTTPVCEYMSKALISVRPHARLDAVLDTLRERDVSCVVVTSDEGELRGIVSMTDLLRVASVERTGSHDFSITPPERTAAEVMKTAVVTIDEMAPVNEAAALLVKHHIHRVVVTRGDRPIAVFSTRDMMRVVQFHHVETPLEKVMTAPVQAIDVGTSIDAAIQELSEKNFRGLVVTDGDWPVGLFTQTEALTAERLPKAVRAMPVEEVMSYAMLCLNVHTPLYRVAAHGAVARARRILAVDLGRLQGIMTGFDLARAAVSGTAG